jgi:hypothetical protein
MLRAEDVSFVKALSTMKVSPALKELRRAIAERRGACPWERGATRAQSPPNEHHSITRARRISPSWLSPAALHSLPRGARHLMLGPYCCPRTHREPRANKTPLPVGTTFPPGRGGVCGLSSRGCSGRNCRPETDK